MRMNCPMCRLSLEHISRQNIRLDYCPSCSIVCLTLLQLERLLGRVESKDGFAAERDRAPTELYLG